MVFAPTRSAMTSTIKTSVRKKRVEFAAEDQDAAGTDDANQRDAKGDGDR